ncbi:hypothetical protein O181_003340 [Austropuccinia psidii MF-1]|uniref:18S rRNA factor 2 n=1 Tax=Austropuccinia psidii MF-1 TaxID=1389203 RepID=A0A9Q3BE97_9BASI|nr:hypothetical protein [Austropuccinia psidii MF-1]
MAHPRKSESTRHLVEKHDTPGHHSLPTTADSPRSSEHGNPDCRSNNSTNELGDDSQSTHEKVREDTSDCSKQNENDGSSGGEPLETKKVIDLNAIQRLDRKIDRSGLIYLSRIPPGMGPSKLKHLLSRWGEIGRIYLARDEELENLQNKKKKKRKKHVHQSHLFKEGWVEFCDKSVARRVAEMLNTRPIGGRRSDRFYSDLWSLTYLPKFKWSNLSDQIAVERREREQLQRKSLEDSKKSQDWYLKMVEKNRVNEKIREKELKRKGEFANTEKWKKNQFRQRELENNSEDETSRDASQSNLTTKATAKREDQEKLKSVLSQLF